MEEYLFEDVKNYIITDPIIMSLFSPDAVRFRYHRADRDERFPYIVFTTKLENSPLEDTPMLSGVLVLDVWDYNADGTRVRRIVHRLKQLLSRAYFSYPGKFSACRIYYDSAEDAPSDRIEIQHVEVICYVRAYDETIF